MDTQSISYEYQKYLAIQDADFYSNTNKKGLWFFFIKNNNL